MVQTIPELIASQACYLNKVTVYRSMNGSDLTTNLRTEICFKSMSIKEINYSGWLLFSDLKGLLISNGINVIRFIKTFPPPPRSNSVVA